MIEETIKKILLENYFLTIRETNTLYRFNGQIYETYEKQIKELIQKTIGNSCRIRHVNEITEAIKRKTATSFENINFEQNDPELIPCLDYIVDMQGVYINEKLELCYEEGSHINYEPDTIFFKQHNIFSPEYLHDMKYYDVSKCKLNKYVSDLFDNQEDEVLVKEILGYCFYRALPFQKFFLFVGSGANGKSTLLNVFEHVLGEDLVSNETLQNLTDNRFAIAELFQKNANISADLPATSLHNSGVLKQLTGGDYVYAERKFREPFKFKNYAKLIFSCNQIPEFNDETNAIYRRVVVVPFKKDFSKTKNLNILKELLEDQKDVSLFAWSCICAFRDALHDGWFIKSFEVEDVKKIVKSYSNNVSVFADEFLDYEPESEISTELIYMVYQNFCFEKHLPVFDERTFGKLLFKEFGHKIYKKRVGSDNVRYHVYVGLTWKKEFVLTEEQKNKINKVLFSHLGGF